MAESEKGISWFAVVDPAGLTVTVSTARATGCVIKLIVAPCATAIHMPASTPIAHFRCAVFGAGVCAVITTVFASNPRLSSEDIVENLQKIARFRDEAA